MKKKITIKKKFLYLVLALFSVLVVAGFFIFSAQKISFNEKAPTQQEMVSEFSMLSHSPLTGSCGALSHAQNGQMFEGACCGKMTEERYLKQRDYLYENFGNVDEIPKDPWNVPSDTAIWFSDYDKKTVLSNEEQKVYDEALEIFDEGPCCCKCWRWFTFEGMAKYMIKEKGFDAEQVAYLWASEDVCGDENPYEEIGDDD